MNTNETGAETKEQLKAVLSQLYTLRDEIRVQVHLAGMDAKEVWNGLDEELTRVERAATKQATVATQAAVTEVIKKLIKFRASLSNS